jgi:hypothetical protein
MQAIYENPAEYPAIYGGDECGAGVRGMQSPSLLFIMPRFLKRGSLLYDQLSATRFCRTGPVYIIFYHQSRLQNL